MRSMNSGFLLFDGGSVDFVIFGIFVEEEDELSRGLLGVCCERARFLALISANCRLFFSLCSFKVVALEEVLEEMLEVLF